MLELCGVSAGYGRQHADQLHEISLQIPKGSFAALLGPNGAGKSTLLQCIAQQLAYRGKIFLGGQELSALPAKQRAREVSFLPQILPSPAFTVREAVQMARNPYLNMHGRLTREDMARVGQAICRAGVEALQEQRMDCISGGERQRVYIAMCLAQDAKVLLLDEPTSFMDATNAAYFFELLTDLCTAHGKTVLAAMHHLEQAVAFADHIAVLQAGRCVFAGTKERCLQQKVIERVFSVRRYEVQGVEEGKKIFFDPERRGWNARAEGNCTNR